MIKKLLGWLDANILAVLAGFLLVFIPLYPKWPLFDILYGYNVRVRLEDFFVAATIIFYILWFLRQKVKLVKEPTTVGLIAYLVVGLISAIVAIFVIQTVPLEKLQVEKTFLHWLRRAEYFSLFFIFFASIKSMRRVKIYVLLFFVTLLAVIVYGYGQKYEYWPAFSTMNREFAKGWWLYLSEHARVLSTFGGHYDLAGYLVIALTLGWSFFFGLKKWLGKAVVFLLIASGFWLLILTASRISFLGYVIGLSLVIFLWMFKKGIGWGLSRWVVTLGLSMLVMLSFGDLSDRFLTLLKLDQRVAVFRAVLLNPSGTPPKNNAMFLQNNIAAVTSASDMPPSTAKPSDVNANAPPLMIAVQTASGTAMVEKPRTYSSNSVMFDLSTGIRLDVTWPRAIAGFKANPITGSGYATLTKATKYEFTDAESTDNDYLRALGETGLLGFGLFFGTIIAMAIIAFKSLGGINDNYFYALIAGFIALIGGLLANALTIDIFESSKVAYVFWGVSGLAMGSLYLNSDQIKKNWKPLRLTFSFKDFLEKVKKFFLSDKPWVILLLLLTFSLRLYKFDGPVADWHSWRQADTSAVTRNFEKAGKINWLYPVYDDLSSLASGKPNLLGLRYVEFPLYNAASYFIKGLAPELTIEEAGRVMTILASVLCTLFLFKIGKKFFSRRAAYLIAISFAVIPYNIFYGRVILPDPSMVAAAIGSIWFASEYLDKGKKRYLILTGIFATAAMLLKPYAIFLLATIGYLLALNFRANYKRVVAVCITGVLSMVPFLLWRGWISYHPEAIPASDWLFNGNGIRFKGAFWYWLFADRIGRLILGFWGLVLLGVSLIRPFTGRYKLFPFVLAGMSLLYLVVFATGNVQHDYYQIVIMPALAMLVGLGLDYLFSYNLRGKVLAVVAFLFMVAFGWYFVKDYFNINHPEIIAAGQKLNSLTENDHRKALVIAPYGGDTAFLYQTNHQGWPIIDGSIDKLIQEGADYYVSVTPNNDVAKALIKDAWPVWQPNPLDIYKKYKLLAYTDQYIIVQLVPDKQLSGN